MKLIRLLTICAAIVAFSTTANADLILQYDSITNSLQNSGVGQLGTYNVDSAFVSNPLSYIGSDGTTVQGLGSVASYPGATPANATTLNGGHPTQGATTTVGREGALNFSDVTFEINPNGGLTGTTADSLAGGNFIFFTFDAAQAFDLTELSALSDPNNGTGRNGARTAGAFVSVNGGTFAQFGSDNAVNNNNARPNTFTDTLSIDSGDSVEVRLAFTNELFTAGFQAATRVGSINVIGVAAVPEPSSLALLGFAAIGFCGFRRRS